MKFTPLVYMIPILLNVTPSFGGLFPEVLIQTGDTIVDQRSGSPVVVGDVQSLEAIALSENSDWHAILDTDHSDTDLDSVLVKNGDVLLREGDTLSTDIGNATLDGFIVTKSFPSVFGPPVYDRPMGSSSFNEANEAALLLQLNLNGNEEDGLYFKKADDTLVFLLRSGSNISGFPKENGTVLGSPSTVTDIHVVEMSEPDSFSERTLLVGISYEEQGTGSIQGLFKYVIDANGLINSTKSEIVAGSGLGVEFPADYYYQTLVLSGLDETDNFTFSMNDQGKYIVPARVENSQGFDFRYGVYFNGSPEALDGEPSPFDGIDWLGSAPSGLSDSNTDINHFSRFAHTGVLDEPSDPPAIILGRDPFVKGGDILQGLQGQDLLGGLTDISNQGLRLTDHGDLLWGGEWDEPSNNRGLFLNKELLIREGVSQVAGETVSGVAGEPAPLMAPSTFYRYDTSKKGKFVGAEVLLSNGNEAFVRFDTKHRCSIQGSSSFIDESKGGSVDLFLTFDSSLLGSGYYYWVLGSASGTSPGIPTPVGTIPLNADGYFDFTINHPNSAQLEDTYQPVDSSGYDTAALNFPANAFPGLVGVTFDHAVIVVDPVTSNIVCVSRGTAPVTLE